MLELGSILPSSLTLVFCGCLTCKYGLTFAISGQWSAVNVNLDKCVPIPKQLTSNMELPVWLTIATLLLVLFLGKDNRTSYVGCSTSKPYCLHISSIIAAISMSLGEPARCGTLENSLEWKSETFIHNEIDNQRLKGFNEVEKSYKTLVQTIQLWHYHQLRQFLCNLGIRT